MLNATAQMPGIDWNTPGVKHVVVVSVVISAALTLFAVMITPLLVRTIKSMGLIKRTWKEEMQAQIQVVAKATATIAEPTNPDAMLPPKQLEAVQQIANGIDAAPDPERKEVA